MARPTIYATLLFQDCSWGFTFSNFSPLGAVYQTQQLNFWTLGQRSESGRLRWLVRNDHRNKAS